MAAVVELMVEKGVLGRAEVLERIEGVSGESGEGVTPDGPVD